MKPSASSTVDLKVNFSRHTTATSSHSPQLTAAVVDTRRRRILRSLFFGTRLRRQNFNLAPTQYCQLRRLRGEPSPQPPPQETYPARRSNYQPHYSPNQPQDDYRHFRQEHRRELNLVALDEHLYNEGRFVAELERNKGSPVSIESQELLHKKKQNYAERE